MSSRPTSTVAGVIRDTRGYGVANARVTLRRNDFVRSIRTRGDGSFHLPCVEHDDYEVSIELRGVSMASQGLAVRADETLEITVEPLSSEVYF